MNSTSKKILDVSLELFSKRGYDAVTVEDIAKVVGIKAPSLYNHFPSKKAIFDALIKNTFEEYENGTNEMSLHTTEFDKDSEMFVNTDYSFLFEKVKQIFLFSIHNKQVSEMRKLLTIEQFRNSEIATLYTTRYVDRLIDYHKGVFSALSKAGIIKYDDLESLAYSYVCPVNTLIGICDRQPEREGECLEKLEKFVKFFFEAVNA